ncbi:MAG TPA: glycosyltransferase family 4 protein [Gemmatimonadaceae bacterium]|nr:glycosyltransferase family 4 protein [Gemmatimonadaceae bacterium]
MSGVGELAIPVSSAVTETGAPIRVCLVGPSLDILGGQAVQLQRLLGRLREIPELEVSFLPVNPRLPGPLRALQRVKYVRTVATSMAYGWSLLRSLGRYDVVHCFSASYWSFLLAPFPAMTVARLYGKAVVLNYRSGQAQDHLTHWPRSAKSMRQAHAIVVPSGYLVDVFARFGLTAESIFNFVDVDAIRYRRRAQPQPVFLSNRNFEAHYNVACVLRAFARIQRELPDARLIVAGDGPQREMLHTLAAELGLRNVDWRGPVPPSAMAQLYDAADVYLNAPSIDNMPNSIIEAYAAGLPIVTTDAGGIPYIVSADRTALMVSRDDDVALAANALRLIQEPGLAARLADTARQECLTKYVWPAVREEWTRLYRRLAAQARTRPAKVA